MWVVVILGESEAGDCESAMQSSHQGKLLAISHAIAVNGRADAIVTFNRRDLAGPAARFGIHVATPPEIYRRLKDR